MFDNVKLIFASLRESSWTLWRRSLNFETHCSAYCAPLLPNVVSHQMCAYSHWRSSPCLCRNEDRPRRHPIADQGSGEGKGWRWCLVHSEILLLILLSSDVEEERHFAVKPYPFAASLNTVTLPIARLKSQNSIGRQKSLKNWSTGIWPLSQFWRQDSLAMKFEAF